MSTIPQNINSLLDIADQIDTVFFDMFGVLWDGEAFYPQALELCQQLVQQHKKVYVLSNTTMLSDEFKKLYLPFNFIQDVTYTDVITSGDVFKVELEQHAFLDQITQSPVGQYFLIGSPNNSLLQSILPRQTDDMTQAKALYLGLPRILQGNTYVRTESMDVFIPLLEQGLALHLPVICANPDYFAIVGGRPCVTQGGLAQWYEDHGGKVYWFGKPHQKIYEYALKKTQAKSQRSVMVGDTIRTDILGGHNAGMKTVLITGYGVTHDRIQKGETLDQIIEQEKATPDFTLAILR